MPSLADVFDLWRLGLREVRLLAGHAEDLEPPAPVPSLSQRSRSKTTRSVRSTPFAKSTTLLWFYLQQHEPRQVGLAMSISYSLSTPSSTKEQFFK